MIHIHMIPLKVGYMYVYWNHRGELVQVYSYHISSFILKTYRYHKLSRIRLWKCRWTSLPINGLWWEIYCDGCVSDWMQWENWNPTTLAQMWGMKITLVLKSKLKASIIYCTVGSKIVLSRYWISIQRNQYVLSSFAAISSKHFKSMSVFLWRHQG